MSSHAGHVVCAVDLGTSAVRAAMVTDDGTRIREARRPRPPGEGAVTYDAEALWADLVGALAELNQDGPVPSCLAIAGHIGALAVDVAGDPVTPGIGWSNGMGADELAAAWAGQEGYLRVAGRPAITGGAAPYLRWLSLSDPDAYRRVRWVLSPKDDLIRRLCGTVCTDVTSAAYTLASDVRQMSWSAELTHAAGLDAALFPPQRHATEVVGEVHPAIARQTGLPPGLPIVAGGPDGTVGAAAVLGDLQGTVVDVAGTTDVLTGLISDPDIPLARSTVINPYLTGKLWTCGGSTGLTGGATAYWTSLLGLGDPAAAKAQLGESLNSVPPGCAGLCVVPALTGSRFPDWRPTDRGALWGLTDRHDAAHLIRATQEAAAYVVRTGLAVLLEGQPADVPVILTGGTARSASLAQLRADVLGRPVLVCDDPDATVRGAAMLACVGVGLHASLANAAAAMGPSLHPISPDPERAAAYDALYAEWSRARESIARDLPSPRGER